VTNLFLLLLLLFAILPVLQEGIWVIDDLLRGSVKAQEVLALAL
jgi:hypothetical protein